MSAVWSGMWQEGGIAVNEGSGGDNSTWLEITIWRRKHTQRHSCEGAWAGLTQDWTRRQKWQNINEWKWQTGSVSVSDKIPLLRRDKKAQTGRADLLPLSLTLKGQERLTDTLEYQLLTPVRWHINFTALYTSGTLFPASYSYPGPPRSPRPLGCSILYKEFRLSGCVWIPSPRLWLQKTVSFHSHQINQSGWTCPLNSPLVSSSVMS